MDSTPPENEPTDQKYIKLANPTDKLKRYRYQNGADYQFETPTKSIPGLGDVYLSGYRFNKNGGDNDANNKNLLYLKDGQVKTAKRGQHDQDLENLFEISLRIFSKLPLGLRCKLKFNDLLLLESDMETEEDEENEDRLKKYSSTTVYWSYNGNSYNLFLPADSNFLSKLEFSFYTPHPADID